MRAQGLGLPYNNGGYKYQTACFLSNDSILSIERPEWSITFVLALSSKISEEKGCA